jgi:Tfp pilus assembly protein PilN
MAQLNLLPDVKMKYIKAQRSRRLLTSICFMITGIAIAILVILLVINFANKQQISSLNNSINNESSELQGKTDIGKVLTVQNQLQSLTGLHQKKPAASRLFGSYLQEVTPNNIFISSFQIDFTQNTATITGTSDSLASVNAFIDALKFATYTSDANSSSTNAFGSVVLSSFGETASATNPSQAASYTVNLSFDPNLFDITQNIKLTVPSQITTRSYLELPTDLFKSSPSGGGQ